MKATKYTASTSSTSSSTPLAFQRMSFRADARHASARPAGPRAHNAIKNKLRFSPDVVSLRCNLRRDVAAIPVRRLMGG